MANRFRVELAKSAEVDAQTYERTQRQYEILQLLARGAAEIEAGVGRDLDAVMADADDLLHQM